MERLHASRCARAYATSEIPVDEKTHGGHGGMGPFGLPSAIVVPLLELPLNVVATGSTITPASAKTSSSPVKRFIWVDLLTGTFSWPGRNRPELSKVFRKRNGGPDG
jgi:hypothetical protein